jgi:hypothetical protein
MPYLQQKFYEGFLVELVASPRSKLRPREVLVVVGPRSTPYNQESPKTKNKDKYPNLDDEMKASMRETWMPFPVSWDGLGEQDQPSNPGHYPSPRISIFKPSLTLSATPAVPETDGLPFVWLTPPERSLSDSLCLPAVYELAAAVTYRFPTRSSSI